MRRRQPLQSFTFDSGYAGAVNPLTSGSDTWAEGSANQVLVGRNLVRPFKGFYTKGTDSGSRVMVQVGDSWGGLANYSSTTARGSLIKDALQSLYAIGAGKLMYEGTKVQIANTSFNLAANTDINTTTDVITKTSHGLTTGQQIRISAATTMPTVIGTALSATTNYFAIVLTANTFQMAYTYTAAMAGTPVIDFTSQGVGTITFYTGTDATASSVLQIASSAINTNWYEHYDQAGLDQPSAPNVTVPTTPGTGFTGLINGAISFKLGAIRDYANEGMDTTTTGPIPVKSIASTTSLVVTPINKTVKIQFPTAQAGQTHWAVFATKQGFGGTGIFLRIGYRTSSAANATWYWGISETTVAAAVGRTLEFDFQDGDLYPEEAWLFDYQPPPGTHFLRLENCGVVLGCYDGTVCAVSIPNFLESYNPFHLLYLPEPVVGVLHRQTDEYAYVACRNSIHVLQYVGFRGDDIASATVTTISPDVGIANQSNWAQCGSTIVAFLEGKGLVQMSNNGDGQINIDYEFGRDVANITQNWSAAATAVCWDPSTQSVVVGNNATSISYCFESGKWGSPVYLGDVSSSLSGLSWVSGVSSRGELIITLTDTSTYTAYSYDNNTSTTRVPTVSISRWQANVAGARSFNIYEVEAAIKQSSATETLVVGVHTNLFPTTIRTVSITSGNDVVTASSSVFTEAYTGKWISVFGAGAGTRIFTVSGLGDRNFNVTDHGFYTGQCVTVSTTGSLPTGLTTLTPYYVIVLSSSQFKLASSLTNALTGTNVVTSSDGTGIQRVVVNFLIGRMTYVSATTVSLTNINTGGTLLAGANGSGLLALTGRYFQGVTAYPNAEQSLVNLRPAIQNVREVCTSVWFPTNASSGAVFANTIFGTTSDASAIAVT